MASPDFAQYQRLFVVDVFSRPTGCHLVVTMRHPDRRHWLFALVRSPLNINFGDVVYGKIDKSGRFEDDTLYLYRGPNLAYHLICDDIPEEVLRRLRAESPGVTLYFEGDGPVEIY